MQAAQASLHIYLKKRRRRRALIIFIGLVFMTAITALIFYALRDKAGFFRIPSEITAADKASQRLLRLGGYVEKGSVARSKDSAEIRFAVTDFHHSQAVVFKGILPDLFREGQGVIAEGRFDAAGGFIAERVLAKHDENYVPKDVSERIKAAEGRSPAAAANR